MPRASTAEPQLSWSQQRRLEFIDFRLQWEGRINRFDLVDFFEISTPQASLDFAKYLSLAPSNASYDPRQKTYLAARRFTPIWGSPDGFSYLNRLAGCTQGSLSNDADYLGWAPPTDVARFPARHVDAGILKRVLAAIRNRRCLQIHYQSMTQPQPTLRTISPHAMAHDGFRWHLRAYCHHRNDFRDFVLARIVHVGSDAATDVDVTHDKAWHTTVRLVLAPHPDLPPGQQRVIELDFGMQAGKAILNTRQALLFYVLQQLRLFPQNQTTPQSQQIVLVNEAEIKPLLTSQASTSAASTSAA